MDYSELMKEVRLSAVKSAERSRQVNLGDLWERFMDIQVEAVLPLIQDVRSHGWYGAIPTWEPVSTLKRSSENPKPIIGIDGSQIYPDPDSPVQWSYIQSCRFRSGEQAILEGEFIDRDSITLPGDDSTMKEGRLDSDQINLKRTNLEVRAAQIASREYPDDVVLFDNALLPYQDYATYSRTWLENYTHQLVDMKGQKIAGYVSSPKSSLILNLISLAESDPNIDKSISHINDSILMRYGLDTGQRSALFMHGSRRNLYMQKPLAPLPTPKNEGTQIFFYYLKVNTEEVARVEIPEWIAIDRNQVDIIHASVLEDCKTFGYPASLFFAHYKVMIPLSVGEELNRMALRVYMEHHGFFQLSAKKRIKGQAP